MSLNLPKFYYFSQFVILQHAEKKTTRHQFELEKTLCIFVRRWSEFFVLLAQ